jgi:hypothetical protein
MLYKTMVLEILQDCPQLHRRLRQEKMLLKTMEFYASALKSLHEGWKARLAEIRPGSDPSQIASQALELALKDLQGSLPSASSSEDEDRPSLDDLMTYLRAHMPPA